MTETPENSATPTPTPTATSPYGSNSDVVIHEVYYRGDANSDWIELKTIGSGNVDIREWYFCALFSYKQLLDNMTILQGDLNLAPSEIVVLRSWTDLDPNGTGSDLAIYQNDNTKPEGRPAFDDPSKMIDFVQWGTPDDVGRPDVAVAKGIWAKTSENPSQYDFIQSAPEGQSLSLAAIEELQV